MDNPRPFPLLRLPTVALQEVLSTMNPLELIFLTKTSQRAKKVVKQFSNLKPFSQYEMYLNFGEPSLEIEGTVEKYHYGISNEVEYDGFEDEDDEYYVKYSEDEIKELMKYTEHVMEVFGWPVKQVNVNFGSFEEKNKSITDWLKTHVKSAKNCCLAGDVISDEYVTAFFSIIEIICVLILDCKMSDNYKLNLPQFIACINIQESEYITFDQIIEFDCRCLILRKTKITNQELNQFFKNWMTSESNVNLISFRIQIENQESINSIVDLPGAEKVDAGTVRVLHRERVVGGWDIENDDGDVATISTKTDLNGDVCLIMLVHWP